MRVRTRPTVYEINTAVWLRRLGRDLGRPLGLGEVPGCEWDVLAALPVDAVWLMGVWQRSPAGRAVAVAEPGPLAGYRAALPDVREDDVIGSPYCVSGDVVDERFGGPDGLARAREQLADRGVALTSTTCPITSRSTIRGFRIVRSAFWAAARRSSRGIRTRLCGSAAGCSRRRATRISRLGRMCCR